MTPKRGRQPFRERVTMLAEAMERDYGPCFEPSATLATPLDRQRAALCLKRSWLTLPVWDGWDIGAVAYRAISLHEELYHFLYRQCFTSTETPMEQRAQGRRPALPAAERKDILAVPTCARWNGRNTINGCACLESFVEMLHGRRTHAGKPAAGGEGLRGIRLEAERHDAPAPRGAALRGLEHAPASLLAHGPRAVPL